MLSLAAVGEEGIAGEERPAAELGLAGSAFEEDGSWAVGDGRVCCCGRGRRGHLADEGRVRWQA